MSVRWLKLTIAYDGTNYAGWQVQPDKPTVQGTIEQAWGEITQETCPHHGRRTDGRWRPCTGASGRYCD